LMVARTAVSKNVLVKILRDNKESIASVTIGELKEEQAPTPSS
jgi:hypothetical protein